MNFIVSVVAPYSHWPKTDQNQSHGRRGNDDPREYLPIVFKDDPAYLAEARARGWPDEANDTDEWAWCNVGPYSNFQPTRFETEQEAKQKVEDVLARQRVRRAVMSRYASPRTSPCLSSTVSSRRRP